jgi:hypothetical protein
MTCRSTAIFACAALAAAIAPATAQDASAASPGYIVTPVPPADGRAKFIPPQGGVYVVNQKTGEILICYPDIKDDKYIVICTVPARLSP